MKSLFYVAVAVVVVVVVATLGVDGRMVMKRPGDGGEEGSGRTSPPPPPPPMYSWEREVGGLTVAQSGNVSANGSVVVVTPPQESLRNLSLSPASVLYAFSDAADTVSAVKMGKGKLSACYLVVPSAGLTFDGVAQNLADRNTSGLATGALQEVKANGTGEALTTEQVEALVTLTPALAKLCRGAKVFLTTPADEAAFPAPEAEEDGQRVVSVVSLDTKVSVLTNTPHAPSRSEDRSGDKAQIRKGGKTQGAPEDRREARPDQRPQTPKKRLGGKILGRRG